MQRTRSSSHLALLQVPLALLLLAACSQPPPGSTGGALRAGTVHVPEGSTVPPVLAAAIVMADYSALGSASTVTEIEENLYLGPVTPISPEGAFELTFPAGADIPAGLLLPAEESIVNLTGLAGCTLTATDPNVLVTGVAFEGLSISGVALVTTEGLYLALATAEEVKDVNAPGLFTSVRSQTWVYASGPTRLTTSPATCEAPLPSEEKASVDVSLAAGWNSLEWTVETDESGAAVEYRLRNSTAEELHLLPFAPFSGG